MLPVISVPLYLLLCAATPFVCELGFKVPPGVSRRPTLLFYSLTPLIGAFAGLGLLILTTSPWVALVLHISIFAVMVVISNAKLKVLRMVATAQDTENFRHLFLYPDFYLVHIGWVRVIIGLCVLAGTIGGLIWLDQGRFLYPTFAGPFIGWLLGCSFWIAAYFFLTRIACLFVRETNATRLGLTRDPNKDAARFGYYVSLLLHSLLVLDTRHIKALARGAPQSASAPTVKPHIILFQGESYMDLARVDGLAGGATPWLSLQALRDNGAVTGLLDVPAWGAYTMQTEMSVLTGIDRHAYKTASINPYQVLASKMPVASIATLLKGHGYKTLCLHPAKRGFFRRDKAMPNLGFDAFWSLSSFDGAERYGPYVSDAALARRVEKILADSDEPVFLHLISIESHGPWEPGRLANWENEADLCAADPTDDISFALYRRHMETLIEATSKMLDAPDGARPRVLGLYGDHQPAHGPLFDRLGFTDPRVDYLFARSDEPVTLASGERRAEDFGFDLLRLAGFTVAQEENT